MKWSKSSGGKERSPGGKLDGGGFGLGGGALLRALPSHHWLPAGRFERREGSQATGTTCCVRRKDRIGPWGPAGPCYVLNDSPQPHWPLEFGLIKTNSDRNRSSTKSMRVPTTCIRALRGREGGRERQSTSQAGRAGARAARHPALAAAAAGRAHQLHAAPFFGVTHPGSIRTLTP